MYIVSNGSKRNTYHVATKNDGTDGSYRAACGYYQHVLSGFTRIQLLTLLPDGRRMCKRCWNIISEVEHGTRNTIVQELFNG